MRNLHNGPTRYIMKAASVVRHALDACVEGTPVTPMEARALLFISTSSASIHQKDIELEYGLSRATVSELMQGMEQKGMIRRQRDETDRRKNRITVCEAFQPFVDGMMARMNAVEEKLSQGIDERELEVFLNIIERMTQNAPPGEG